MLCEDLMGKLYRPKRFAVNAGGMVQKQHTARMKGGVGLAVCEPRRGGIHTAKE